MTRVLVTRPSGDQSALVTPLLKAGIKVDSVPCVAIEPSADADIARLAELVSRADWVVITSANGVPALATALGGRPLPPRARLAAVGPTTAAALERSGLPVDVVPPRFLTAAIAEALGDVAGKCVVLARADAATPELCRALVAGGASVEEVTAYRTVEGPPASRDAVRLALHSAPDGILFTSGSTVRGLLKLAPSHQVKSVRRVPAICIGPVTAEAARRSGFSVPAVAHRHTAGGLAQATIEYFHEAAS